MTDLFDFNPVQRSYAVMGNPVAHSKSPLIHTLFGTQCDISLKYTRIQVDPGGFDQAVSHFSAHGGAGLNITVPFKLEAWQLCKRPGNTLSDRAELAESVNTLMFKPGSVVEGHNTDGIGLLRDIEHNIGRPINKSRVLVIGAGGAVRGVLGPLLGAQPSSLHLVNRTASRASDLAARFNQLGFNQITGGSLEQVESGYDLVINGSAASLAGELPAVNPCCIGPDTLAYDMMYGNEPTLFMKWAKDCGAAQVSDGLGMLVEQAAESFMLWHGKRPESAPVISHLRKL